MFSGEWKWGKHFFYTHSPKVEDFSPCDSQVFDFMLMAAIFAFVFCLEHWLNKSYALSPQNRELRNRRSIVPLMWENENALFSESKVFFPQGYHFCYHQYDSLLHISGMCGPLTLFNPISASVSHSPHVALKYESKALVTNREKERGVSAKMGNYSFLCLPSLACSGS